MRCQISQLSNSNSINSLQLDTSTQPPHQSSSPHQLKILSLNARSLLPKIDELRGLCGSEKFDIICVSETWLTDAIQDNEVGIHGYNLLWKDRHRHGGGVAIYLASNLPHKSIHFPHPDIELIMLNFRFTLSSSQLPASIAPIKEIMPPWPSSTVCFLISNPKIFQTSSSVATLTLIPLTLVTLTTLSCYRFKMNSACHRLLRNLPESLQVLPQPLTLF